MKKVIIAVAAAAAGAVAGYMIKDKMDKKANDGKTAKDAPSGDGQTTNATAGMGDPYFTQYIPLEQQVDYLYNPRLIQ